MILLDSGLSLDLNLQFQRSSLYYLKMKGLPICEDTNMCELLTTLAILQVFITLQIIILLLLVMKQFRGRIKISHALIIKQNTREEI